MGTNDINPRQHTVIIWDSLGNDDIKFLVYPGDLRHLNGHYLNVAPPAGAETEWDKLDTELTEIMTDEGQFARGGRMKAEFPTQAVLEGAFVIVCGMIP